MRYYIIAGEASGGVHGRNRLMGNSQLDIIVFGKRAGQNASDRAKTISDAGKLSMDDNGDIYVLDDQAISSVDLNDLSTPREAWQIL